MGRDREKEREGRMDGEERKNKKEEIGRLCDKGEEGRKLEKKWRKEPQRERK